MPLVEAAYWAHAQCKFSDPARLTKAPVAVERDIIGPSLEERRTVRQERSRPRLEALGIWLREQYARLPPDSQVAKAIAYGLHAWGALVRFLDDGRPCLSNNARRRSTRWVRTKQRRLLAQQSP